VEVDIKTNLERKQMKTGQKYEDRYSVELARGGSHIGSTRSVDTLHAAVAEVLEDFVTRHGVADLAAFLDLLAVGLEKREFPDAAALVRRVAIVGIEKALEELADAKKAPSKSQAKPKNTAQRSTRKKQ
jgi:hypothetical protein